MNNPYASYQQNAVNTMTPGEMVVALYDGAIKQINIAMVNVDQKNYTSSHTALMKAQDIICYLKNTLNHDVAMSQQLHALYEFYLEQIMHANIKKDNQPLMDILPLMTEMKLAFVQADKMSRMR